MSEIKHKTTIKATREAVYQALSTVQGLKSWFTPHVEGSGKPGSNWNLSFTHEPFFSWHILACENLKRIVWRCIEGPGNAAGTEVEFTLESPSSNQTILVIRHRGWMENDSKFERCIVIWRNLIDHLQHYCESGIENPAYS